MATHLPARRAVPIKSHSCTLLKRTIPRHTRKRQHRLAAIDNIEIMHIRSLELATQNYLLIDLIVTSHHYTLPVLLVREDQAKHLLPSNIHSPEVEGIEVLEQRRAAPY